MKARQILTGLLICAIAFSVMGISSANAAVQLTFAEYDAPGTLSGYAAELVKEEIEKATDGEVTVKIFWGGSLLKGKEMLRGVSEGMVSMGHVNPNYFPNQLPMNGAYAVLPQGPSEYENINWLFKESMTKVPELQEELLKNNQVTLFEFAVLPKSLTSTKPIASLADYKGYKIRASNRWALSMLEAAGAVPVSVPWSDCFMALQTGTVDAVYTNLDSIHRSKLDEIAPNIFLCKPLWSGTKFITTINKKTWDKMSEETQKQIWTAMDRVAERYAAEFEKTWDQVVKEMTDMGCVMNSITPEDVKTWSNMPVIEELQATWIKEQEERGVDNASDIFKRLKAAVDEAIAREEGN